VLLRAMRFDPIEEEAGLGRGARRPPRRLVDPDGGLHARLL